DDALQREPGDDRDHELHGRAAGETRAHPEAAHRAENLLTASGDEPVRHSPGGGRPRDHQARRFPPAAGSWRAPEGERMTAGRAPIFEAVVVAGARTPMAALNTHFK